MSESQLTLVDVIGTLKASNFLKVKGINEQG